MNEEFATRLDRIEGMLAVLVERQTVRDWYGTEEFARLVGKAEFTVRNGAGWAGSRPRSGSPAAALIPRG